MLDPIRAGTVAVGIADRMAELDASHASEFKSKAKAIQDRLAGKVKTWQARIEKTSVKDIVTYHKTLTYFFDRFKLKNPAMLEPKPGIPPTTGHILDVIATIKKDKVPLIMVENYFDPTVTNRIKEAVPSVRVAVVPVSVEGTSDIKTLDDLYEKLVSTVEGK
jgi:zinc/manganese transport system substrate-binding protein